VTQAIAATLQELFTKREELAVWGLSDSEKRAESESDVSEMATKARVDRAAKV
jgi:hypothetical protein